MLASLLIGSITVLILCVITALVEDFIIKKPRSASSSHLKGKS